jgi:hypothetical protein
VAVGEFVFVKVGDWHGYVLLFATGIGEAEVNKLDFIVLHHLHHVCDGLCHQILLRMGVDNWFYGNAVSMPTKAEHHNGPSPLLCPEDRGALCDFPGIFCINLMHHNTPQMHYYSA